MLNIVEDPTGAYRPMPWVTKLSLRLVESKSSNGAGRGLFWKVGTALVGDETEDVDWWVGDVMGTVLS